MYLRRRRPASAGCVPSGEKRDADRCGIAGDGGVRRRRGGSSRRLPDSGSAGATRIVWGARSSDGSDAAAPWRIAMSFLVASQIMLWIGLLVLGVVCMALARQIGVLHQRIAPAGALSLRQPLKLGDPAPDMVLPGLDGSPVKIGGVRAGRSQMLLFLSPDCAICETLLPAVRSAQGAERGWLDIILASDGEQYKHEAFVREKGLTKFPYVVSEHLGRSYGVSKLPYAVLIDEAGRLSSTGLVNTREHLESLFVAKETGVSSIQQFLSQRGPRQASSGE